MKKYVLTLSKTFPKSNKRSGELTGFEVAEGRSGDAGQ